MINVIFVVGGSGGGGGGGSAVAAAAVASATFYFHTSGVHFTAALRDIWRTKAIHDIAQPQEETSDSDEEFDIGSITQENKDGSEVYYIENVEGIDANFKIDTGAQVNILPYHLMKGMKHKLYQTKAKLKTYTGTAITVKGKTDLAVNGQKHEFFIVEDKHLTPILGYRSAKKLEIIKIMSVTIKEYPTVFGGLGCLKEPYKIQIDKEVKPVIRKIPVALQQKLKDKLTDMEHKGVIKKVHVPTEWANGLVIVEKQDSKDIRLCPDPRNLNKAIKRDHHPLPTIEEKLLDWQEQKSLSEAESRYAQIEKELLAVVFGLERFENLTYGQHVTVLSDHKPLEAILNKPICLSSLRLQRMLIRLHKFHITLNYKQGKNMFISDILSRAYLKEKHVVDEQIEKDIHLYVNQIRDSWNVKDYKLKQIEAETSRDIDLQDLKKQILEGFPAKRNNLMRNLHDFFTNSEKLSIQGDLNLKETPNITGLKYSPAQLLFNRRLHDNIPTLKINLKPAIPAKARQELEARQRKQKAFFDRHAKPYKQDCKKGDKVRVQLKDKCIEGRLQDKHKTRSYWINTDSDQAMYRRNTRFIRHDKSSPAAPAQGNNDSYNPVQSDNGKINPNSHFIKDKLTQSKHSGRTPSHDLLQTHSSASSLRASTAAVPPAMTCCNLISKHSGSPPSHELLQSHSSASSLRASTAAVLPAMTCCNLIVQLAHSEQAQRQSPSHDLLQSHSSTSSLRASTAAVHPAMTCCNLIVQLAHSEQAQRQSSQP
ncbi:retrovirus-related pol polyprotein from transposon 297 [Plakobranchus ocellatus]|uniref:Retrovirus-related pol polyprotein from transposon 297 n=1 Tax=Plakobranchus ocellatus TaxID=259542 RepID=A0AAV3YRE9_9GAST|nr:retrovirus-related pol polyprotein from transposon 297 [Plakobranchus ocellatus]